MIGSGSEELLRMRIASVICDDEEFIEEIYLDVNYSTDTVHVPEYAGISKTNVMRYHVPIFRLVEVIECVCQMENEGLVASRSTEGFPSICGVTARMFRLTQQGEEYYHKTVVPKLESIFPLEA